MTRCTVLAYHAVGACDDDPHNLWMPTPRFEEQMAYLATARRVVALDDVVAGRLPSGKPAVALTFDDAYRSVLTHAAPVLARHGFPATVFTPSAYLGDRNRWDGPSSCPLDIMGPEELRAIEELGVAVESHGHAHLDLSAASAEVARADLAPSLDLLAAAVGRRPRYLAYPFRSGSMAAREVAAELGFEAAFTIDLPHDGRFAWGRVQVTPLDSSRMFALKTSGCYLALRHNPVLAAGYRLVRRR